MSRLQFQSSWKKTEEGIKVLHILNPVQCTKFLDRFSAVSSKCYSRLSEFPDEGQNLGGIWVLIRIYGWGVKGHPHASIMYQESGQNSKPYEVNIMGGCVSFQIKV